MSQMEVDLQQKEVYDEYLGNEKDDKGKEKDDKQKLDALSYYSQVH